MQYAMQAHAKINWALDIRAQRADGYHELDMLMQTIALSDTLLFAPAKPLTLTIGGRPLPNGNRNLVIRAAQALCAYAGIADGAKIALIKRIPVRAGLGGGSADCATTLLALNTLWRLGLSAEKLAEIGRTLGADVPYCLRGGFARVRGMGEKLLPLTPPKPIALLIVHPGGGLSTASVFQTWDAGGYRPLDLDMREIQSALKRGDLDALREKCGNALEEAAISLMPEIAKVKRALYDGGAGYAQMSGSGSAVFGAFQTMAEAQSARERLPYPSILTQTC